MVGVLNGWGLKWLGSKRVGVLNGWGPKWFEVINGRSLIGLGS